MSISRLEFLFFRYSNHSSTMQEVEELMRLLEKPENEEKIKKLIDQFVKSNEQEIQMPGDVENTILQNIFNSDRETAIDLHYKKPALSFMERFAVAATILLLVGAAYWIFHQQEGNGKIITSQHVPGEIMPGGDRAILTIGDGSVIQLDDVQNGMVAQQGDTRVDKQGSLLSYNAKVTQQNTTIVYNTLSTPKGGQYQVLLPDGSRAWLNAASSLHFPTAFQGSSREITLTGEGYFEVVKNSEKPFVVNVGEMKIEVLGTHFNVNAYADEGVIKTSLLEGTVQVANNNQRKFLKPGQQALLTREDNKLKISNVNLEAVMAWKNGLFQFEGADITSLMRQVGRWYDVNIIYAGKIPRMQFEGKISRKAQLYEVLEILELNEIRLKVDHKNIIIY